MESWRGALGVVLAVGLAGGPARGEGPLPATGARSIVTRSTIPRGVEAFIPPDGAYALAVTALGEGRFRIAAERFADAAAEARRAALHDAPCAAGTRCGDGRLSRAQARLVIRRANFAAAEARVALQREVQRLAPAAARPAPSADFEEAVAVHNLFLAARAFAGRDVPALRTRAEAAFRRALAAPGGERSARVHFGLAGLLADTGDLKGAAAEFARVAEADRTAEAADFLAHYYSSIGDRDRAFEILGAARDTLPEWAELAAFLRMSNDLDPLRPDPRFRRILGSDDNGE